ncbi:hypothetical protein CD036_12080, partial [Staphylococcus arlettae]
PDDNVEPEPPQDGGTAGTEYPNDAPGSGGGQTEPPQTGDTDGDQSNNTQPDDNVEPEPPQDGGTAG